MLQSYVYENEYPYSAIADADIILIDSNGNRKEVIGRTDENGDFSVNWPSSGYGIEISRAGYEPLVFKNPSTEIGLSGIGLTPTEIGTIGEVVVTAKRKPAPAKKKNYTLPIALGSASVIAFGFAFFYKW